jgi:hypothetical protein
MPQVVAHGEASRARPRVRLPVLVAVAVLLFPPFGLPAVGLVRAARRAAVAHDHQGSASALRRARYWVLAALLAAAVTAPAGFFAWTQSTATCVCVSSTFEPE